jgi:DNA adenine methylase
MGTTLTPPLKWHGGKNANNGKPAKWIVSLMPRHLHYCEAYGGGLAVLLTRDTDDPRLWVEENPLAHRRGVSEVVNDLNGRLMNFWRVLQRPETFERFCRIVQAVPFSEAEWQDAAGRLDHDDPVEAAVAFFVRCRQSLAGRMNAFSGLTRTRTRGNRNAEANAWWRVIEGLPAVARRLENVLVLNRPALEVIRQEDGPEVLFYLDPPYPHGTRTARRVYGEFEMTDADHRELLGVVRQCQGKVMLSGYPNELYDRTLHDWNRPTLDVSNCASSARTKGRETEVLWCNF